MPLSLSRTTRSFGNKDFASSGGGIQGIFKKDVDPFESAVPRSYVPQKVIRREPRAVNLELNGFNKPEVPEQAPTAPAPLPLVSNHFPANPKTTPRRGRGHKRHFADPNLPLRNVCSDASVEVGSALVLTHSPQSLAHLRKWNSQLYLPVVTARPGKNEFLSPVKRHALRWNVSLPDIREAVKAERQRLRRPRRHEALLRTPSDVGRTLAFWIRDGEDEGHVESFDVLSPGHRIKYKHKLSFLRTRQQRHFREVDLSLNREYENNPPETLSNFSSQTLAEELTLLAREMLLAVETAELVTLVMRPLAADEENCPNLTRLVHFYERVSALVCTEVLMSGDPSFRAQTLATFVETADLCRGFHNRQSTAALMAGLRSPPVVRLRQTWTRLRNEYPEVYSKYESLVTGATPPELENDPHKLSAVASFAEILDRIRGRPTIRHIRPPRALWKEPPSLASWVEEQTTVVSNCDTCASTGGHHPCCYLLVFVLGRNLFCPVRKMPPEGTEVEVAPQMSVITETRVHLAKSFDDPDSLPFASKHIQCCALQPTALPDVLRRAELSLRSAQAAARVYDFPVNKSARHYLLNQPYSSGSKNMRRSLEVESQRSTRFRIL